MKIIIVLPAYNAEKTLGLTIESIPTNLRSNIILCDDSSHDFTVEYSKQLGLITLEHSKNLGYGANQKTLYNEALRLGAEVIVMLHPDFQYYGEDIPKLIEPILKGEKDFMLGSRIKHAREGRMPLWKYFANRLLTIIEKIRFQEYGIHEFHSGFRAYSKAFLDNIDYNSFNDDFSFDSQMIAECMKRHYRIGEIDTRTRYFKEASSIRFKPALKYGIFTLYYIMLNK